MKIKIKNYVISESQTFTYTLENVSNDDLLFLMSILLKSNTLFDFRMNAKSNTLSFYLRDLSEFNEVKIKFKKIFSK